MAVRLISHLAACLVAVALSGCSKTEDASATCAELDRVTDPARRAELQKQCPRSGPSFKPSKPKEW